MKNPILAHIERADRLFPLAARVPRVLRRKLVKSYSEAMGRRMNSRSFPDRLTIFVTNRCNLNCAHCFVDKDKKLNGEETTLEQYRQFFSKNSGRFSQILFTGGEPTLRDDFADILILSNSVGGLGSASIFTNGFCQERLLEIVQRVLKESSLVLSLQFSLDGLQPFNDANRGRDGAMQKTLSSIEGLVGLKRRFPKRFARLVVATAISKRNLKDLPGVIAIVEKTGLLHAFGFVRGSGVSVFNLRHKEELSRYQPADFQDYLSVCDMDQALGVIAGALWSKHRYNLYYATNRAILQAIRDMLHYQRPIVNCMAGLAELTLLADGEVSRCEMLKGCAQLKDFDWDLAALVASDSFQSHYRKTYGCWCAHECAVGTSIMYDLNLLNRLFDAKITPSGPGG